VGKAKLDHRAREIADLASSRRVVARRLPMDCTLAGVLGTWLAFAPNVLGLWMFFGLAALWAGGGLYTVISTTRKLAGTLPEERGKRSDDKALAKAQTQTLGCLGILVVGTAGIVLVFHAHRGTWPWQPWIAALGGLIGQICSVGAVAWSRRAHRAVPAPCLGGESEKETGGTA